jgi:hypothetical protein
MSSTFYTDGYRDGLDNNPKQTMNVRKTTNNFNNIEYNQGYVDAQRDINRVLKTMAQVGYAMLTESDKKIADYVLD